MRIAYLTSRLPYPPIGGDRLRAYHFLRHLLRSHEVTLYAIDAPLKGSAPTKPHDLHGLRSRLVRLSPASYGRNALRGLFSRLPLQVRLYESRALGLALRDDVKCGRIDLLLVHLVRMAEYARPFHGLPRILDMTDSIYLNYARMPAGVLKPLAIASRIDRQRLAAYEADVTQWFDRVLLTSPADIESVRTRGGRDNLVLVPEGVDVEGYEASTRCPVERRIIFFGNLRSMPNEDASIRFAREIFPLVRMSVPDATLAIVGWNPPRAVRALAALPGVTVLASVPNILPELAGSWVSVAPMRFGAGIQNKILESLAAGVPVVVSREASLAFGDAADRGPILVGRDPAEFADRVVAVLRDEEYRTRLSREGRNFVEDRFRWEHVMAPLDLALADHGASAPPTEAGARPGASATPHASTPARQIKVYGR